MSDMPFKRPGDAHRPATESRPFESSPPTLEAASHDVTPGAPDAPGWKSRAGVLLGVGFAGIVAGGLVVGFLSTKYHAAPEPLGITVKTFPDYVLGLEREDVSVRRSGDAAAVLELDAAFERRLEQYRFSYGGDGAGMDYGQSLILTIVNGRQTLPLPTGDDVVAGGPTLVSLETDAVSCVFTPEVGLYDSAVLDAPPDLTADGRTECVLHDSKRNLSLRLESRVPGGANQTSEDFARTLEQVHGKLID